MNTNQPIYNYQIQAYVLDGIIQDCNHPKEGELTALGEVFEGCNCYGRRFAGQPYGPQYRSLDGGKTEREFERLMNF